MASGHRIGDLAPGQSTVLSKVEHGGSLEARRMKTGGVTFYWRHTQDGLTERTPIGPYDSSAPPRSLAKTARGYSIQAALLSARKLAEQNSSVPGGIRAQREREAAEKLAEEQRQQALLRFTLKALCEQYVARLKSTGKTSWRSVENTFAKHVFGAGEDGAKLFPRLHDRPANDIQDDELVTVIGRVVENGHLSTARKLRAHLRAAFECARRARTDTTLHTAFAGFQVRSNPVKDITAIPNQSAKNPLTLTELRAYWKTLQGVEGVKGAALRLHLLSGAQRAQQMTRLTAADAEGDLLRIFDRKGKRLRAREHLVPITKAMRKELTQLPARGFVLSTDGGTTAMHATSLSAWAAEVGQKAKIEGFQLKRVRSSVETQLSRAGVPKEDRAHLQSHGIGGVQDNNYDAYDRLTEKRKALEVLYELLEPKLAHAASRT